MIKITILKDFEAELWKANHSLGSMFLLQDAGDYIDGIISYDNL